MMILISDQAFEKLIAHANEIGEEMWRCYVFDHPGMLDNMPADFADEFRQNFIDNFAERYCERVANAANEYLDRKEA